MLIFENYLSKIFGLLIISSFSTMLYAANYYDSDIVHKPKDKILKIYGAGGPHVAFKKIAENYSKETGNKVEIIFGPESTWTKKAQADADIIWGTSEQSMTGFLNNYKGFKSKDVMPIYIRPAIIAVKKGNPKKIKGINDLLRPNMKIIVTEGGGVANTSGSGVWEDIVGRNGKLDEIINFRKNIISFEPNSGSSFKSFVKLDADAWITWPNWVSSNPNVLEGINIDNQRKIWRDLNIVVSPEADDNAGEFLKYLVSSKAKYLMSLEGWAR
ncbi:substrate-binding domain-containing protein [Acinetobacter calcoaceticus]|jgi:accessory colonization factor AcfC|uniref:Accessory colonization factor AcfC n=1 Tax=Acinetobacter calcoaceticus TaxID=471 RepID=A0ABD5AKK8_ACICA|nr:substrate-binding domain-containing protein [Acinetobacter calcoaceticus]MDP9802960.1 accessory colonization factor AcfC [Acinetobacter calcoaceticus]